MIRKIIKIDEESCNGCGLCASACHEGAIGIVDGKAVLLRDDYCDGLGNCLPVCPTGAITFEEREAAAFDEAEVQKSKGAAPASTSTLPPEPLPAHEPAHATACGCPSSTARTFERPAAAASGSVAAEQGFCCSAQVPDADNSVSNLRQWPVQIQLVPVNAPYFKGAHLLVAADCAAYSHPSFNQTFMKNKITLIGCPKLDDTDYSEKLAAILAGNDIRSLTVIRMEVPCCGGIVAAAVQALRNCGKMIPWSVVTLATDGSVLEN